MKRTMTILLLCLTFFAAPVLAWDGYDWQNNSYIEIEGGNLVRKGKDIEVYDYSKGEYKTYEVESVNRNEVEVYDWRSGEYRTFDMD
ncbi:MAG: DUF5334 domain-containing protein [Candidatus Gastranaerophilales bacterium]|nr:DUF5334 domain-containing protein [Candidatus Gastranaerophilales bacterium]